MQQLLSDEFRGILFGLDSKEEFKKPSERKPLVPVNDLAEMWADEWPSNGAPRRPCQFCNKMKPVNVMCNCDTLRSPIALRLKQMMQQHDQEPFKSDMQVAQEFAELNAEVERAQEFEQLAEELEVKSPYKQGTQDYLAILEKMRDLHIRKNTGYSGHSDDTWYNFRSCERWGGDAITGVMYRMTDKWSRLESLMVNEANDQVGETMSDTLMDLAAYALIMVCLRQERGLS